VGVTGLDVTYWMAVQAPAGTPPAVVDQVYATLKQAASDPKTRASLAVQGDVIMMPPGPFAQRIEREIKLWGDVIRREKLSLE
jgi:tripartite-type tricarboxylate transporter receptor subunit TctC